MKPASLATWVGLLVGAAAAGLYCGVWDGRPADETEARFEAIHARLAVKEQDYAALIDGRMSLQDVVRRSMMANREWPPVDPIVFPDEPGRSLGERMAHRVVLTIDHSLANDPRREAVGRRLRGELAALTTSGALLDDAPAGRPRRAPLAEGPYP
jgi:hypothetical protein